MNKESYDIFYKDVNYNSVHELISKKLPHVTIYYNGNQYRGSCGINFPRYNTDDEAMNEIIKVVGSILKVDF